MSSTTERRDRSTVTDPSTHAWVTLQRTVAIGQVAAIVLVMVVVAQAIIPPLVVFATLFTIPLVTSSRRPRGSAIAIGTLASLLLVMTIAMDPTLGRTIANPGDVGPFVTTVARLVLSAAGAVGLVGLLRRTSGTIATGTVRVAAGVLGLAVVIAGVASVVQPDEPVTVADGPATVTLRDIAFQPASLQVPAGATVTWEWDDGAIQHDVVGDEFASDVKADGDFEYTFDTPGTYAYRCTLHPGMTGTVTVVDE